VATCEYCEYKYKSKKFEYPDVDFTCKEDPRTGSSTLCIFHDENYIKDNYEEFEHKATKRFEEKVKESSSDNKPLECIGYHLPSIEFAKYFPTTTTPEKSFSQPVYFVKTTFYGANFRGATFSNVAYFTDATFSNEANFRGATFSNEANFSGTKFSYGAYFTEAIFSNEAYFSGTKFSNDKPGTFFNYMIFEEPNKVLFEESDLSKVSFAGTDITRIRFGDKIRWSKDGFTIVEEEWLREQTEKKQKEKEEEKEEEKVKEKIERVSLELVLSVYRNLRENYEFRLRYDDAGKFFIKEMELKRKYRTVRSKNGKDPKENGKDPKVKKNDWFRRNLFSLTGLYYNLFVYGEDLKRPALMLLLPLLIVSTVYWGAINASPSFSNDGFALWLNATARTAFDMSQVERKTPELMDTAIKTVTLVILGTLLIPLRRKFERKYTR
jgi:Pentapeptide repeats (9 copies)